MRRPAPNLYGNARSVDSNSDQPLAADVELAAYGVSKDATEVQLKEFILSKGIRVTDVKKLTTYEHARTHRSFFLRGWGGFSPPKILRSVKTVHCFNKSSAPF